MAFVHDLGWSLPKGILKSTSAGSVRVGGLAVRFSGPDEPDLDGEFFTADTDFGSLSEALPTLFHHGLPMKPGLERVASMVFPSGIATKRSNGISFEAFLSEDDPWQAAILDLIDQGKLRWSSGSSRPSVRKRNGEILVWPPVEFSYTPMPAEWRLPPIKVL